MTIRRLNEEGRSLRDIAGIVGVAFKTVDNIIGVQNEPLAKSTQEEPTETSGEQDDSVSETPQEEPLSAFAHATSVEPILNPFANDNEEETDTGEVVEAITTKATSKSNVPEEIIKMFNTLPKAQQDEVLLILSDIATEF
jgi:DNA-directed RNA polymerase specialized sigma24 family protein